MPTLTWNDLGDRLFEAGVDRGVLYVEPLDGVAWNGLTSVTESPTGGDPDPYYMDGVKIFNLPKAEEFEGTITAFVSPPEFDRCDGTVALTSGFYATNQRRNTFGLCYRTKVGNDVEGVEHGYKLHLIYGALASPTEHSNATISDVVEPGELSWAITTTPIFIDQYKPTSHLIVDSRTTPAPLMALIEDYLYGTDTTPAQLPTPQRIMELYGDLGDFIITILTNGLYSAEGWSVEVLSPGDFALTHDTVNMIGDGLFEAGVDDTPPPPISGLTFFLFGVNNYEAEGTAVTLVPNITYPNQFAVDHIFAFLDGVTTFHLDDSVTTPPPPPTINTFDVVTFTSTTYTVTGSAVNNPTVNDFDMTDATVTYHGDGSFDITFFSSGVVPAPLGASPLGTSYLGGTP